MLYFPARMLAQYVSRSPAPGKIPLIPTMAISPSGSSAAATASDAAARKTSVDSSEIRRWRSATEYTESCRRMACPAM
jgi:hypothetical protein